VSKETARPDQPLLDVRGLTTVFGSPPARAVAVDSVSFTIGRAEALGLVGESGSGKTVTALSILRLVADPPGEIVGGEVFFKGRDLLGLDPGEIRAVRGNEISLILQEPATALNPVLTVGAQIAEALSLHKKTARRDARDRAVEFLGRVGIPSPEKIARSWPHQLSGGTIQRAMIAMALICGPDLLIADEPTSALDVTIQAQILDLVGRLRQEEAMSLLLISHDLGVVAGICDRVAVMYAAEIVEEAGKDRLFERPSHPYTVALLRSVPTLSRRQNRLRPIPGSVPRPTAHPAGCRFRPRCPKARPLCAERKPNLEELAPGHRVACFFPDREV